MKHYIIDGNNLIGKIKNLSALQNKDKQSAREQLVFLLQNYFAVKKVKLSLHFDGFENARLNIQHGKIIYSGSRTADEKIKEQISSVKNRKEIIVVTSDNGIRDFAKVCGCTLNSSEEFYKDFSSKNEVNEEEKRIREINDVEEFKRLFNDNS